MSTIPRKPSTVPTLDEIQARSWAQLRMSSSTCAQSLRRACHLRTMTRHHPWLVTSLAFSAGVLVVMALRPRADRTTPATITLQPAPLYLPQAAAPSLPPAQHHAASSAVGAIFSWLFDEGFHLSLLSLISGFLKSNHPEAQETTAEA